MRQIDMSAEAVTARLKLVSQLRRLCLSLGTAKIKTRDPVTAEQRTKIRPTRESASPKAK
jgi:hypothetical protein